MLSGIRTFSKSIFAKVLFGVIAISFVAWGLKASMLNLGNSREVAEIGNQSVSPVELDRAFKRNIDKMRRVFGPSFDQQQAIQMGMLQNTVQGLISQKLLAQDAEDLGIGISDEKVRDSIFKTKSFADPKTGQFDRERFNQLLYANGYSEQEFIEGMRQNLMSQQILGSLDGAANAPKPLVAKIAAYRDEERQGRYFTLDDTDIGDVSTPSDDVLKKYHKDHADKFTAPETRDATIALLTVDHLAKSVKVTDQEVQDAYNQRLAEFQTPEKRDVEQILFGPNEKQSAMDAYQALQNGADFMKIATDKAGMQESVVKLGEFTKDNILPDLRDAVFSLKEGEISKPVETSLGWHILRVTKITPKHEQSLDEVRQKVIEDVQHSKAQDEIYDVAANLDDELGAGTPLKQAADKVGAQLYTIKDIKQGADLGHNIRDSKEITAKIYGLTQGDESMIEQTKDGDRYVVNVDKVTPSALRPFEDVRADVLAAWKADEQKRLKKEKADALAKQINEQGAKFDAVAKDLDDSINDTGMTKRDGSGLAPDVPPAVAGTLFGLDQGKAKTVQSGDDVLLVVLDTVKAAKQSTGDDKDIASELSQGIGQDLTSEYLDHLQNEISVSVNNSVIQGLYPQAGNGN